jgi:proline racemase
MFKKMQNWQAPKDWLNIKTIDLHTGGEPLRVIYDGLPEIKGNSILEKRSYFKNHFDYIRKGLMLEPRGHADMYGAIITKSIAKDADFGHFLFTQRGLFHHVWPCHYCSYKTGF